MVHKITSLFLLLLIMSSCKKEPGVCKDPNAINFDMYDQFGGSSCNYAININRDIFGKWKVLYHLVYDLPENVTLQELIAQYSSLTYVEFEELYDTDYPLNERDWAEFITDQLNLTFVEIETPANASVHAKIEYTTDHQVHYYQGNDLIDNISHNWTQFDYDHIAYYDTYYVPSDVSDMVKIELLNSNSLNYKRTLTHPGGSKSIEVRQCIKDE